MAEQREIDTARLLETAVEAARRAGKLIEDGISGDLKIEFKEEGNYNLVTAMDRASEGLIQEYISSRHPGSIFLAEESGGNHHLDELTWVIDPIDGTVNYVHGIPIYSISIAAVLRNEPVVGVIYAPALGELFTTVRGQGAFLNGKRLRVSANDDMLKSLLVTGFPYNVAENPYGCIDAFVDFLKLGVPIRRLGSAALDLAYVAAGRLDGYWEVSLNAWDVAAGVLMIAEAGGIVETYADEPAASSIVTSRILATNGRIAEAMKRVLRRR
jgi:myo-inositol-1(or 4)-monophosphatase